MWGMMTIFRLLGLLLLSVGFGTCRSRQVFPSEPRIEFVFLEPSEIKALTGSFDIEIKYQDGDGNLGSDNPDDKNFFVIDNRTNLPDSVRTFSYSLPDLSSNARNPSIQGTIKVKVPLALSSSFFYPYPLPAEEITDFSVYLMDRSGNKSNVIVTSRVKIQP
jgi:hypothetical protein